VATGAAAEDATAVVAGTGAAEVDATAWLSSTTGAATGAATATELEEELGAGGGIDEDGDEGKIVDSAPWLQIEGAAEVPWVAVETGLPSWST
jgi:hypothetical protein